VLLLCLLAVLAGAETFVDIALFGEKKLELLRRFLPFRDGTLSHDHLGDIFATLDAERFQGCFVSWVSALIGAPAEVIALSLRQKLWGRRRGCSTIVVARSDGVPHGPIRRPEPLPRRL